MLFQSIKTARAEAERLLRPMCRALLRTFAPQKGNKEFTQKQRIAVSDTEN